MYSELLTPEQRALESWFTFKPEQKVWTFYKGAWTEGVFVYGARQVRLNGAHGSDGTPIVVGSRFTYPMFQVGDQINAFDNGNRLYSGRIKAVNPSSYIVEYDGWPSSHDEEILFTDMCRIRPYQPLLVSRTILHTTSDHVTLPRCVQSIDVIRKQIVFERDEKQYPLESACGLRDRPLTLFPGQIVRIKNGCQEESAHVTRYNVNQPMSVDVLDNHGVLHTKSIRDVFWHCESKPMPATQEPDSEIKSPSTQLLDVLTQLNGLNHLKPSPNSITIGSTAIGYTTTTIGSCSLNFNSSTGNLSSADKPTEQPKLDVSKKTCPTIDDAESDDCDEDDDEDDEIKSGTKDDFVQVNSIAGEPKEEHGPQNKSRPKNLVMTDDQGIWYLQEGWPVLYCGLPAMVYQIQSNFITLKVTSTGCVSSSGFQFVEVIDGYHPQLSPVVAHELYLAYLGISGEEASTKTKHILDAIQRKIAEKEVVWAKCSQFSTPFMVLGQGSSPNHWKIRLDRSRDVFELDVRQVTFIDVSRHFLTSRLLYALLL